MSDDIIRPEQNIPPRENFKEDDNISLPGEVSKKQQRTLRDFGDVSHKSQEDIILDTEPEKKESINIEESVKKENKESIEINQQTDRKLKEDEAIPDKESDTNKEDVEISDENVHTAKTDEIIPDKESDTNKKDVEILDINTRTSKTDEVIPDKEHDHAYKDEQIAYTERIHPIKEESEYENQDHTEKREEELDDKTHEEKIETEVLGEKDHPSKEEIEFANQTHEEKTETEIKDTDRESKTEEEILKEKEHNIKGESEISYDVNVIEKEEVDFIKDGKDYNFNQLERENKIETRGYNLGQPEIDIKSDTEYEDGLDKISDRTLSDRYKKEIDAQREDKTENGPTDIQVNKSTPSDQQTENVHFDDIKTTSESVKGDDYTFNSVSPDLEENVNFSNEYSLRKEKTNKKDPNNYSSTLPSSEQEGAKTYRTIGSMSDTTNRQYQALFTYDIKDPENRFPSGPKEEGENIEYSTNEELKSSINDDLDPDRNNKLSDVATESGDYLEDKETAALQDSYVSITEVNDTLEKTTNIFQSTTNYSYETIMTTFLNSLSESTDRPINQPAQPDNDVNYPSIKNLDKSIISVDKSSTDVLESTDINNSSEYNEVIDRANPKIANYDTTVDSEGNETTVSSDINGIDNTDASRQVAASAHETAKKYGQINRGSEANLPAPAAYNSQITINGSTFDVSHISSPKFGDRDIVYREPGSIEEQEMGPIASITAGDLTYSDYIIGDQVTLIDSTSISSPEIPSRIVNDELANGENILSRAIQEGTVHKYSPKVGQREGDVAEDSGIEFRAADLLQGPAGIMSLGIDYLEDRILTDRDIINVPYIIDNNISPTNTSNEIKFGTVKPKVDIRTPLASFLTSIVGTGYGAGLVSSIITNIVESGLSVAASKAAESAARYSNATINDTFANIATREILTDGMRFAYSRMHSALLYGPDQSGISPSDILDIDETTLGGNLVAGITRLVTPVMRIPPSANRDDILRRGFDPLKMNRYFNKTAGAVYDNMTTYLNSLRGYIDGISLGLNPPNNESIESIDVDSQKRIARNQSSSSEIDTIISMLSPMEYKNFRDNKTGDPGYNIEEDRKGNVEGSDYSYRQFNQTQKPSKSEDLENGTWLAPRGDDNFKWENIESSKKYHERIRSYREAGFANATQMAADDFRIKYFFFDEGGAAPVINDNLIEELESTDTQRLYTTIESNSTEMNNVYRTGGLRRQSVNSNQKPYFTGDDENEIVYHGDIKDVHARINDGVNVSAGIKDDFYDALKNADSGDIKTYSIGSMKYKETTEELDTNNMLNLKEIIAANSNVDLSPLMHVVHPDVSREVYLNSAINRNTITYIDSEGNETENAPEEAHLAEVYNAQYIPNQGKDLFSSITEFPSFAQKEGISDNNISLIDNLENVLFHSADYDGDFIKSVNATYPYKNNYISKAISTNESSFSYVEDHGPENAPTVDRHLFQIENVSRVKEGKDGFIKQIDSSEHYSATNISLTTDSISIIKNLQTQLDIENNDLSGIISLNKGVSTAQSTISEDGELVGSTNNAKKNNNTIIDEAIVSNHPNAHSRETQSTGENLVEISLDREDINEATIDEEKTVEIDPSTGIGTDATRQELQTKDIKKNVELSFRYGSHTFSRTSDEYTYGGKEQILSNGEGNNEIPENRERTMTINKINRKRYHSSTDGLGHIMVMKNYSNPVSQKSGNDYLYNIPFQFNPEISGENRTANWSNQQAFGRTNDIRLWSNTSSRSVQLKTTVAIIAGTSEPSRKGPTDSTINQIYDWGKTWTEDGVLQTVNKYRMLVLPFSGVGNSPNDLISPPIIAIIRGRNELTWTSSYPNELYYARWIVTDLAIDPRDETGFTLNNVPRVFDIVLTLSEVFKSVRSYQYIEGMTAQLGVSYEVGEAITAK